MIRDSVVTIKEASRILGVNEATLRQWTDEGRLKAFITPGGHRRYAKSDLLKFMKASQKVLDVKDLASEMEDTVRLHRQTARSHLEATAWYSKLDRSSQERLAELGRRLLGLIVRHVTDAFGAGGDHRAGARDRAGLRHDAGRIRAAPDGLGRGFHASPRYHNECRRPFNEKT